MRIAIATEGQRVAAHFGRCPLYTIVDIEGGEVVKRFEIENPGHEPGRIPQFLDEQGASAIISGGMGQRAIGFFRQFKIETVVGVTGPIDSVIHSILEGTLEGGESLCDHGEGHGDGHGHGDGQHHEHGHGDCGDHH